MGRGGGGDCHPPRPGSPARVPTALSCNEAKQVQKLLYIEEEEEEEQEEFFNETRQGNRLLYKKAQEKMLYNEARCGGAETKQGKVESCCALGLQ